MRFTFRPTTRNDFPLLRRWLSTPHVARYWVHDTSEAGVEADFGGAVDGTEPSEDFIASLDGRPVGFIQRCRISDYADELAELAALTEVRPTTITVDYYLGEPDVLGKGLASRLIADFAARCWRDIPDATDIVVAVTESNPASWRALERAGFRRVASGLMEPDNPRDDRMHHVYRLTRPVLADGAGSARAAGTGR
ncbi:aminoglycoside 6'-N-acetyltransferase [Stackebrandtia albiflava]|uniref:Aminoglycoside 6'-N-acetyltransferase n=1 Tax=Stackebrandtia albiflava TaxID=406432 RepID=A0A562VGY8_9ACTN|nr:GNAT family N-acetyltransferase [Stackebrandtia albiflava]TWJ17094.1 aminoglycoside 6'-N-acetyltransferase [Stackebrandtia albiflava]